METDVLSQEEIIQIELFQYQQLATNKLLQVIGSSLLSGLLIGSVIYFYFKVDIELIIIGLSVLIIALLLTLSRLSYYNLNNDLTLIIAFGEMQLMKNKKIIWCEKIEYLVFTYEAYSNHQIPMLTIEGTTFSKISIGYGRPKTTTTNEELIYLVFSKLDWNILKKSTKMKIPMEYNRLYSK